MKRSPSNSWTACCRVIYKLQLEVLRYVTESGKGPISEWLAGLPDDRARAKVVARFARLAAGNFGDCKLLGMASRSYGSITGPAIEPITRWPGRDRVLLLCAGDKRKQSSDIKRAIEFWTDYQRRTARP
jgi:putative addiction module killer protein